MHQVNACPSAIRPAIPFLQWPFEDESIAKTIDTTDTDEQTLHFGGLICVYVYRRCDLRPLNIAFRDNSSRVIPSARIYRQQHKSVRLTEGCDAASNINDADSFFRCLGWLTEVIEMAIHPLVLMRNGTADLQKANAAVTYRKPNKEKLVPREGFLAFGAWV